MRRVGLLSLHVPPSAASGAFRMLGFARFLPEYGWSPVVLGCTAVPGEPVDATLRAAMPPGTPIQYVDYPDSRVSAAARRVLSLTDVIDRHAVWCIAARKACDEWIARERPEVILTSGPTHAVHLLGLWLRRRHGVPVVTDFRDNWTDPDQPINLTASIRRRLERATIRSADAVVANAPRARETMVRLCPDRADRIVVVPNGFDPFPAGSGPVSPARGEPLSILHAGELYAGRNPLFLLNAIAAAERATPAHVSWHLRFIGRVGGTRTDPVAVGASLGLRSRVTVEGQMPYDRVKSEMQRAGILLLMDGPGRQVGVPAKVYEYLGADRPILALAEPESDTAWALETGGARYRIARLRDTGGIERALLEITEMARTDAGSGRTADESPFTRRKLAGTLAACLDDVVANDKPRMKQ